MKKLINRKYLNLELISQRFNIKKENIIGMLVDDNYFKIFTKRRLKNAYYTSNSFKTYKSPSRNRQ